MAILREQYGDNIPEPDDIRIARWQQAPFFNGSYSFMKVRADSQLRRDLAQSVNDKLCFAGEATSWDDPATVHGALLSWLKRSRKDPPADIHFEGIDVEDIKGSNPTVLFSIALPAGYAGNSKIQVADSDPVFFGPLFRQ